MRLDLALVRCGLVPSRERAKAAILAGEVSTNGLVRCKPGHEVSEDDAISLLKEHSYVGRGYLKLQKALEVFSIAISGQICMDIGASTGGFTQLLLQRGAQKVFAIDVGTGQLADILKADPRVVNLEKTDFRTLKKEQIDLCGFACADVSFISLKLILPHLFSLLEETGQAVCLVKPQFETGKSVKHGIVKDAKTQIRVLEEICDAARLSGFACRGLTHSPITGGEGNIEFLLHLARGEKSPDAAIDIQQAVRLAWEELKS